MFQALAGYAVRGPVQAALLASSTLLLSLILPPMAVISSAIVALVWLRHGSKVGSLAVGIALVVSTAIAFFSGLQPLAPTAVMVSSWLPVVVMAVVLRRTVSLDLAILSGVALVAAGVVIAYMVIPDPAASWRELFSVFSENLALQAPGTDGANPAQMKELLDRASTLMTGFYAATLFLIASLSLLLARGWQARLFNPGGLQREFHELRFGRGASIVGLALLVTSQVLGIEMLYSLAMLVVAVFAFQGMAVIHALVTSRKLPKGLLIGAYVLLMVLSPEAALVVGLIGMTDAWLDYRKRFGNSAHPGEPT